ncbi:STAS/SEC14 domain-containing protein [Alkalicoccus daliensis]|uniref:SpoIIAA-like n=1 Tax=Alkalicoccus daliensis TaxID=745820 RepID=A0A1H0G8Y4_9BACI|nr:STAS/SEC14 domain-containing protein [Alkalicoccus daliensis]SDO03321.1 SpoIIAA-like [Alkalicoccus daliensis]
MNGKLDWSSGNVIAFEVDSKIEEKEYKEATAEIEELLDRYKKINVFLKVSDLEGVELSTMKDRIQFIKENDLEQVDKFAVVGEQNTMQALSKGIDIFADTNVRQFPLEKEDEAKKWIQQN